MGMLPRPARCGRGIGIESSAVANPMDSCSLRVFEAGIWLFYHNSPWPAILIDSSTVVRPRLHVFTMANERHGGFLSSCGLMRRLQSHFHVDAWPLTGATPDENATALREAADEVHLDGGVPACDIRGHVLFYMNDYPPLFSNFSRQWQRALRDAASVQIAFNRTLGSLPREHWLARQVTRIYFHDSWMGESWRFLTNESPLADIPAEVLAPPADLTRFLRISAPRSGPVVVGRFAGDASVPRNAVELYRQLSDNVPEAEWWFMPAPAALEEVFGGDRRFRFFARNAMDPVEFLSSCHIAALTYWAGVPVPGPRSLMEAMAAGCAPVVIDREGPRDRVIHGESGFRTNDDLEFIDYIARLARDPVLRDRIRESLHPGRYVRGGLPNQRR